MIQTVLKAKEDSTEEVLAQIPVLLPHKILDYLFNDLGLAIPAEKLRQYWQHCKQFCPWASNNDELDGSHIPLALYGDTARYGTGFDQSKVTGCFLSLVLWRPKSTRMSQFLLWNLNGELSLGAKSHNPLYLAVVNSLNTLFDGGPVGHKFVVTEIKGDWEYHWQTFRLVRYWKTNFICWRCSAANTPNAEHSCFDVMTDQPSWMGTQVSHDDFVVNGSKDDFLCPGALSDVMHSLQNKLG